MAVSFDQGAPKKVWFGRPWRRSKTVDGGDCGPNPDGSNNYAATDCSLSQKNDVDSILGEGGGSVRVFRCNRHSSCPPPSDSEDEDFFDSSRRSVLFRCFGSRRHGSKTKKTNDGSATRRLRSRVASFYSVYSVCEKDGTGRAGLADGSIDEDFFSVIGDFDELSTSVDEGTLCACGFAGHSITFHPEMPLFCPSGVEMGSYDECLIVAKSCVGHWVTMIERSESLDPQYRLIGLGMVKRAVMNRLAVPLTMFLEDNDQILHCWIHTPLGIRHMRSSLLGKEIIDDDPDAGQWMGTAKIVDYSIPWFCNGKSVRALQQVRVNPKVGKCIETRCVLPDRQEGKIMLFNFTMIPKGKTEGNKESADRLLKYIGEKAIGV